LTACRNLAAKLTGLTTEFPHDEIQIRSEIVSRNSAGKTGGHAFLNSSIADDLKAVADEVQAGNYGVALKEYLRPDDELDVSRRIDVRTRLDDVLAATAPQFVPAGHWPGSPAHPLALSQQLAVNRALPMLAAGAGIFSVNGPPGTDKTTVLRDLVAAVVVERARRLADLPNPADAFTGEQLEWQSGEFTRVVHAWKPQFAGFEMVVVTPGNVPTENSPVHNSPVHNSPAKDSPVETSPAETSPVEIPAADAIDDFWRAGATSFDYFPDIAAAVSAAGRDDEDGQHGLLKILKGYELSSSSPPWPDAVRLFKQALDRVSSIQAKRGRVHDDLTRAARVDEELRTAKQRLAGAEQEIQRGQDQFMLAQRSAEEQRQLRDNWAAERETHHRFRPGLWRWLTSGGEATREWRARDGRLADELAAAEQGLRAAVASARQRAGDADAAKKTAAEASAAAVRSERELAALSHALTQASRALGPHFPNSTWWQNRERRELAALWTDNEWNQARSALFLAALQLHKAFLEHTAGPMRQSLHGAADILSGDAPDDVPPAAALAAWQALFFVVPVVSTTFASFASLFAHLGREALGWLLVDEAGRAAPQNAVGALWRAKRAVVVGDPLRLRPVTPLPSHAEQAIRSDHGVDELWLSTRTSVQQLADRVNPWGTWLSSGEKQIWVGVPLAVHRGCDQPMFGLVNDIAYDGLMINMTVPQPAAELQEAYPSLPPSKWIDVVADQAEGQWVPDEGVELDRLLRTLKQMDFDMSRVMVIAPFRDIAREVSDRVTAYPGMVAGTIRTTQDRQADILILVLGSAAQHTDARSWAAGTPNLLNVAVSRAKRRLYVIGNRKLWAGQRHFDVLAHRLPAEPPHPA
jgi:hypothetical protein